MTERAAFALKICHGQDAAVRVRVTRFDFPIPQSVPSKGVDVSQVKDQRDFKSEKCREQELNRAQPSHRLKMNGGLAGQFPSSKWKSNTHNGDESRQKRSANEKTERP